MNIAIIGTGAYGIALAMNIYKKNHVTMWTKFEDEYNMLNDYHKNIKVLPNVEIPKEIEISMDLGYCVQKKDIVIIAIPSTNYEQMCQELKLYLDNNTIICIASKGMTEDNRFLSDVVESYLENDIVVLSGPSFASDLIDLKPIGLTIASKKEIIAKKFESIFSNKYLCFDHTCDIIGTQICGVIKNAFAIGSGILDGLNCLESTKATYITNCIQNMISFFPILGADFKTVLCYCGIGDLILTCGSKKSRNFSYGKLIGSKASNEEIEIFKDNHLIEGIYALRGISRLSQEKNYCIDIIQLIYNILENKQNPEILFEFINKKSN